MLGNGVSVIGWDGALCGAGAVAGLQGSWVWMLADAAS